MEALRPLYLIDGEETVLADEAARELVERGLADAPRDFNYDRLEGSKTTTPRVIEVAKMLPMLAKRRVVLVTEADKLDLSDGLEAYIKAPNPSTTLILRALRFDGRGRAYKAAKKAGFSLRFDRPKAREMPRIIQQRAQQIGLKLEPAAARALADAVGVDVGAARQALDVLSLYIAHEPSRAIRSADVAKVVASSREENVFELIDAIAQRDRKKLLSGLHGMLRVNQEHPLRIFALVSRAYRNLLIARSGMDAGWPKSRLQSAMGVPPFVVDKMQKQARGYSTPQLVVQLRRAEQADRAMKGGALDSGQDLERLVFSMLS